jgi:hypothetical protein
MAEYGYLTAATEPNARNERVHHDREEERSVRVADGVRGVRSHGGQNTSIGSRNHGCCSTGVSSYDNVDWLTRKLIATVEDLDDERRSPKKLDLDEWEIGRDDEGASPFTAGFAPARGRTFEETPATLVFRGANLLIVMANSARVSFHFPVPADIGLHTPIFVSGWWEARSGDRFASMLRLGERVFQFDNDRKLIVPR